MFEIVQVLCGVVSCHRRIVNYFFRSEPDAVWKLGCSGRHDSCFTCNVIDVISNAVVLSSTYTAEHHRSKNFVQTLFINVSSCPSWLNCVNRVLTLDSGLHRAVTLLYHDLTPTLKQFFFRCCTAPSAWNRLSLHIRTSPTYLHTSSKQT